MTTTKPLAKKDTWQHVLLTYDGSGKAEGLRLYVDGAMAPLNLEINKLTTSSQARTPTRVGQRSTSEPFEGAAQEVRFYDRALSAAEAFGDTNRRTRAQRSSSAVMRSTRPTRHAARSRRRLRVRGTGHGEAQGEQHRGRSSDEPEPGHLAEHHAEVLLVHSFRGSHASPPRRGGPGRPGPPVKADPGSGDLREARGQARLLVTRTCR